MNSTDKFERFNERTFSPLRIRMRNIKSVRYTEKSLSVNPIIKSINCNIDGHRKGKTSDYFTKIRLLNKFYNDIFRTQPHNTKMRIEANRRDEPRVFSPQASIIFTNSNIKEKRPIEPQNRLFSARHSSLAKVIDLYKMKIQSRKKFDDKCVTPSVNMQQMVYLKESMTVNHLPLKSPFMSHRISFSQQTNPFSQVDFSAKNMVNPGKVYVPISTIKSKCNENKGHPDEISGWEIEEEKMRLL